MKEEAESTGKCVDARGTSVGREVGATDRHWPWKPRCLDTCTLGTEKRKDGEIIGGKRLKPTCERN